MGGHQRLHRQPRLLVIQRPSATKGECIQSEVMHPRLPVVRYLWEASIQHPDWRVDRDNPEESLANRYRHWRLHHGYFILEDAPDPDYPTEQKRYTVRPLGPVSVSPPDMCDRMLKYGYLGEECQ